MTDDPPELKALHDISLALRADGYTVGFDASDLNDDFTDHVTESKRLLDVDDLGGYFIVAHRDGQTDYASDVVVEDSLAYGIVQIEMLAAHFRAVHETLPLSVGDLVDAMVDEAVTVEDNEGYEPP